MNFLPEHFIEKKIIKDLQEGVYAGLKTRFPPEPNGYLHLGHAKSICLNFTLAEKYGGGCNLRFDDTNPSKEEQEYVESIKEDVAWLGFQWNECCYASDYFEKFYDAAVQLIKKGKAFVDESTPEEIRSMRGTLTVHGQESPYRNRSVEENLKAFEKMKAGGYPEGGAVLRAKISMQSSNIVMRDPVLYRIKFEAHQHRGRDWVIYPMYDFAHCLSDAIEGITHSICTLEFQDNRALYDWVLDELGMHPRPFQYEFSKLNIEGLVLSKRKLHALVESGKVDGWDDPRMPTLRALRRRGYPPEALRLFCSRLGISKQDSGRVELSALEGCVREVLNKTAPRGMGVVRPIRLKFVNFPPERRSIPLTTPCHPVEASYGVRELNLSETLYISSKDFRKEPLPGYKRMVLGGVIRLRHACVVRALSCLENEAGEVTEVWVEADWESIGQPSSQFGKPSGVIHWVPSESAKAVEFRLYAPLFQVPSSNEGDLEGTVSEEPVFNEHSCTALEGFLEENVWKEMIQDPKPYQLEREGYFVLDPRLKGEKGSPVLHQTVSLKGVMEA